MFKQKVGRGLARFMELRGRRIVESESALWHSTDGKMLMSLPYHLALDPEPGEMRNLLRGTGSLGVRYPSITREGTPGGLYVCRDKEYSLKTVQSRLRSKVRRGLEHCEVREVTPSELLGQGLRLNQETMSRQGRYESEFGEALPFARLVGAVDASARITAFGSFIDGILGAYAVTYEEDGWFHILHQMSRLDCLEHYPNHALAYTLTEAALSRPEIVGMSYGLKSLVNTAGLHDFKLRMGFECLSQNMVCELHPMASGMLTSGLASFGLRTVRKCFPRDQRLERVQAVISSARVAKGLVPLEPVMAGSMESEAASQEEVA
ncbi:MAG: hypothetical protein K2X03_17725 [Bryobacteraceae bacterium]|nr:hypothetical protein [Bryobacteraceae bacterium]